MNLYGKQWTRRELEARFGRIEQVGGLLRQQASEGPETGVEQIRVRSGAGLEYTVLPSRGMDIGLAEFGGVALSWLSPAGEVHPAYFDDKGLGWLRSAAGGLLMTCGLTQAGAPGEDEGAALGLHGRAHHSAARQVSAQAEWEGDEYRMRVRGQIEEASLFGAHLRLTRTITSTLGQNSLTVEDEVENLGFEPAPHMLLYHFNFGFPLMSEETRVSFPQGKVRGREADLTLEGLADWQAPQPDYQERVYYHEELETKADGSSEVRIHNPRFPRPGGKASGALTVSLRWDTRSLPYLVEWKMPGMGMHVLGIEPANCHVGGRAAERKAGTLVTLGAGQVVRYALKVSVEQE